ncbi:MAG: carbamate kinase [Ignavibacteriaceae bacterium]
MRKLAVVALGGNALLKGNQDGSITQQEKNTYDTCKNLLNLLKKDFEIVLTHGNGPQVGNILLRNEAGYNQYKIPKMPLDICVADSQGGIGYMIERQMKNLLIENKIDKNVLTVITQVLVDYDDPAFKEPTKPIGAFYLKEEADLLAKVNNWVFKEDSRKRGWRRVVASPKPLEVLNKNIIKELAMNGNIVIAAGGGGVPVYRNNDKLYGIDAVIDKDLASALLAKEINADNFYILTDVPKVYLNFGKPDQKAIDKITIDEIKKYFDIGEFASGSMKPKILAAMNFIENGGKQTVITDASELISNSEIGTIITS